MPTINEIMERVDRVKPVADIDDQDKARWLIQLDGRIWQEIVMKSVHDTMPEEPPKSWPEDGDKQLLVSSPYDNLYDLYVIGMMEFSMREYGNYNNTMQAFNTALGSFANWYRNTHEPVSAGGFKNIFP